MATWIVHLRIAEQLLEQFPGLDAVQFAYGNIAPDSGIPDEKWENFTPPPAVTHFFVPPGPNWGSTWGSDDLAFYRAHLADCPLDADEYALRLGYFCHLLTDNLWRRQILHPTRARWPAEFAADKDFIWEVKRDWYGLDFIYLRDHPQCAIWQTFLHGGEPHYRLDFLPAEALQQRVDYIRQYYSTIDDEVRAGYARPYIYLSQAEADRFVDDATNRIAAIIHALPHPATEGISALDWALDGRE